MEAAFEEELAWVPYRRKAQELGPYRKEAAQVPHQGEVLEPASHLKEVAKA